MAKGYNEIKKILESKYSEFFQILDLESTIRAIDFYLVDEKDYKDFLLKQLDHYMECEKITASQTAYEFHNWYKWNYERKLEIYNKLKGDE